MVLGIVLPIIAITLMAIFVVVFVWLKKRPRRQIGLFNYYKKENNFNC
jgi:hypothetical protein